MDPGPGSAEYFSIKSAVCRSRILRRASSSFVPRFLTTALKCDEWSDLWERWGVTSEEGLGYENSVKGAITGGVDV
ncbi:hypothetical protein Tco_0301403, partial [Tanacetum coccineum]